MSLSQFLVDHRSDPSKLPWEKRWRIIRHITSGYVYLHSIKFYHKGVKSTNILLTAKLTAKITDYAFHQVKREAGNISKMLTGGGHTAVNMAYSAPESFNFKASPAPDKIDVFGYGLLLWEISTLLEPFKDQDEATVKANVVAGNLPQVDDETPDLIKSLITACRNLDPTKRPTMASVLAQIEELLDQEETKAGWLEEATDYLQEKTHYDENMRYLINKAFRKYSDDNAVIKLAMELLYSGLRHGLPEGSETDNDRAFDFLLHPHETEKKEEKKDEKKEKKEETKQSHIRFILTTYPDDPDTLEFTIKTLTHVLSNATGKATKDKENLIGACIDEVFALLDKHPKNIKLLEAIFDTLGQFSLREGFRNKILAHLKTLVAIMKAHPTPLLIDRCAGCLCNLANDKKTDYKTDLLKSGALELFDEALKSNDSTSTGFHNTKACTSVLHKAQAAQKK